MNCNMLNHNPPNINLTNISLSNINPPSKYSNINLNQCFFVFDLDDTLYQKHNVVEEDRTGIENIKLYPNVREILTQLKQNNVPLFLVTKGEVRFQNEKIDRLKIRELFEQVLICEYSEEKKKLFLTLLQKYPLFTGIVVGDRLSVEIRYGNELNMLTIRLKQGKYASENPTEAIQIPQYELNSWIKLENLIKTWGKKQL